MTIYRAQCTYNNCEYREFEEWFTEHSHWYTTREEAEKHLPYLKEMLDDLKRDINGEDYVTQFWFRCTEPTIVSVEVLEEFENSTTID